MDPEIKAFFEKSMKKSTFLDRIKYKIKFAKISDSEVDLMKQVLIKEAKPLFSDFWLNRQNKNIIDDLTVQFFDKRIMSLSKGIILELYSNFNDLKKAESKEAKEYTYNYFITNLSLYYSLDGWFIKNLFQYYKNK